MLNFQDYSYYLKKISVTILLKKCSVSAVCTLYLTSIKIYVIMFLKKCSVSAVCTQYLTSIKILAIDNFVGHFLGIRVIIPILK